MSAAVSLSFARSKGDGAALAAQGVGMLIWTCC